MNRLTGLILLSASFPNTTNIRYLSGFTSPDPFLFIKAGKRKFLVVSPLEKGRAKKEVSADIQVFTPGDLGLNEGDRDYTAQIQSVAKKAEIDRLEVPPDFPVGVFNTLQKHGFDIAVSEKPICPERRVKDAVETAKLRKSQQAAVAAMKAAIQLIGSSKLSGKNSLCTGKEELTSEKVRQQIYQVLIDHHCSGFETIVAGGDQAIDPHERGYGPLFPGQAIVIDIFPRSEKTGYWGDLTRTVCRGAASPELKRLYDTVKKAQEAALRSLKPGVCTDKIHNLCKKIFDNSGFRTGEIEGKQAGFIHGTGHGVGLDIHEFPRIGASGEVLQSGHVVTIEPGLYYPGLGGVRIEDTVVITETGFYFLAPFPKKFEILQTIDV